MSALTWDTDGTRKYSLGVSKGVLFTYDDTAKKWVGVAWNGLTSVTESPEGGDANDLWADNILYGSLRGTEKLTGTIEAYDYPDEFEPCIGGAEIIDGMTIHQQVRKPFCFAYRSETGEGNNPSVGYKINIIYNATANASERQSETINDSPDAEPFSFDFDSVPVPVTGYKPTSCVHFDSTQISAANMKKIEDAIYGTADADSYLPTPDQFADMLKAA